jgi:5'-nucleotidase
MWHSGTLAAAKQAALFGVRGIALSAPPLETIEDYVVIRPYARRVLETLFGMPAPPLLVNANFPAAPTGVAWTRQSVRQYDGKVVPTQDPAGRTLFWFAAVPIESVEPGTDRRAVSEGLVSLTPLRLDLTDHPGLADVRGASSAAEHPSTPAGTLERRSN